METVQIQSSWLFQKPADLALHCLQRRVYLGSAGLGLRFLDHFRPSSIAWEVRKMSPGKSPSGMGHHGHTSPSPAQRVLNFSYPADQKSKQRLVALILVFYTW